MFLDHFLTIRINTRQVSKLKVIFFINNLHNVLLHSFVNLKVKIKFFSLRRSVLYISMTSCNIRFRPNDVTEFTLPKRPVQDTLKHIEIDLGNKFMECMHSV